jgi:hypothetical protein
MTGRIEMELLDGEIKLQAYRGAGCVYSANAWVIPGTTGYFFRDSTQTGRRRARSYESAITVLMRLAIATLKKGGVNGD